MPEFEFPMNVRIYQAPSIRSGAKIMLELPVAEASELLLWLQLLSTGFMDDAQYQYFAGFKRRLADAVNPTTVADFVDVSADELKKLGDN